MFLTLDLVECIVVTIFEGGTTIEAIHGITFSTEG
jgi:hypothetical protein